MVREGGPSRIVSKKEKGHPLMKLKKVGGYKLKTPTHHLGEKKQVSGGAPCARKRKKRNANCKAGKFIRLFREEKKKEFSFLGSEGMRRAHFPAQLAWIRREIESGQGIIGKKALALWQPQGGGKRSVRTSWGQEEGKGAVYTLRTKREEKKGTRGR